MPNTRQGHLPCSVCDRYASEWQRVGNVRRAVTAPYGVKVKEGQEWTCTVCVERGHEQRATNKLEHK